MQRGYISEIFVSFQGEGPYAGRRHLFIRLAGCNLRCRYCDTPGGLERTPGFRVHREGGSTEGRNPLCASELLVRSAPLLDAEGPIDGIALTGGEPLLQADFLAELLAAEALPHPRLLETSGTLPERLAVVLPWIDVVSMDLKAPSNTGEAGFWREHEQFLKLARGKVYVKIPVDAGTALEEVERAVALVREEAPETPVFLQPITAPSGRICLSEGALSGFFAAARKHVDDVRILPQTHKMLGIR